MPSSRVVPMAALISCLLASSLVLGTSAVAQRTLPSRMATNPAPLAPFADSIGTVNLPGFMSFALPQTYGQCVDAVRLAKHEASVRDSSQDSLPEPLRRPQPVSPAVRAIAETCRTRIQAGKTTNPKIPEAPELQSTFELAVVLGDSTESIVALDRWLAAPRTLADRSESATETHLKRLMIAVHLYYDAEAPVELRAWSLGHAKTFVARLDSLGPEATNARLLTQMLMVYAETEWRSQSAGLFSDPERTIREYLALLPAYDSVSGPDVGMYNDEGGVGQIVLGIRVAQSLIVDSPVLPVLDSLATHPSLNGNVSRAARREAKRRGDLNKMGQPIPPLHAPFWYHTGVVPWDSVWPVPGHVSLLLIGDVSAADAPFLRLLAQRYSAHGLRITLVNKTKGYWDRGGIETGPRTAAQEAAQDSAYYLGHLKLPLTVAVEETPFAQNQHGIFVQSAPVSYERDWGDGGSCLLGDAQGRFLRRWGTCDERYMITYLDHLFGIQTP